LTSFAYRVDISPASYTITLLLIVLMLIVTVSTQTFRSANASPAETLREE
jgi:putative ABC transport system permease protein